MLLLGRDEVMRIQHLASSLVCSESVGNPRWIENSCRGYKCAKQLPGSHKVSLRLLDTHKGRAWTHWALQSRSEGSEQWQLEGKTLAHGLEHEKYGINKSETRTETQGELALPKEGAKGQSGYGVVWLAWSGYQRPWGKKKELRTSTNCRSLT